MATLDIEKVLTPKTRIAVIGPRAHNHRQTLKTLAKFGAALAIGSWFGDGVGYLGKQGVFSEIYAYNNPVAVHQPVVQNTRWMTLPSSVFLEAAKRPDGSYSSDQLMVAFDRAGVTRYDASTIVSQFRYLAPVLMRGEDPVLEQMYQEQAQEALHTLSQFGQYEQRLSQMVGGNFILKGTDDEHFIRNRYAAAITHWFPSSDMKVSTTDGRHDIPWDEVHKYLYQAMDQTGLRALRIMPQLMSKDRLIAFSHQLMMANDGLQQVTNWDQQVLGLGGRVVLSTYPPVRRLEAAGTAQVHDNGVLEVHANWSNVAHEWFHALDYTLAPKTMRRAHHGTLTNQMLPLRVVLDEQLWNSMDALRQSITQSTPQWQEHIHTHIAQSTTKEEAHQYWTSSTEQLAYAFQAHVNQSNQTFIMRSQTPEDALYYAPSNEEVAQMAEKWTTFFAQTKHLNLTEQILMMKASKQNHVTAKRTNHEHGY